MEVNMNFRVIFTLKDFFNFNFWKLLLIDAAFFDVEIANISKYCKKKLPLDVFYIFTQFG